MFLALSASREESNVGNPIVVNVDMPVDSPDVLAGSALDPVPGPGTVSVYAASTQRDGRITIGGPSVPGGGAFLVPPVLRANGMPDLSTDMPYILRVVGGKLAVNYDEVTAGDAFLTVIYVPD